jgi:hypothetical protein
MSSRIIKWCVVPFADGWEDEEPDAIVWIDVALFDAAWQDSGAWIGKGGVAQQGNRYTDFGPWFAEGLPINMCYIGVSEGQVTFGDGRHRFA